MDANSVMTNNQVRITSKRWVSEWGGGGAQVYAKVYVEVYVYVYVEVSKNIHGYMKQFRYLSFTSLHT